MLLFIYVHMAVVIPHVAATALQLDTNQLVSMLDGTVLPVLVGLVTKKVTKEGTKAILLALLSALAGFGAEYLGDPDKFILTAALLNWLQTFIIAVAMHFGFWKPTGVSAKAQDIPLTGRHKAN